MSLVSRNLMSAKKTPPKDSSASNSLENQELDQSSVSWSTRNLVRSGESASSGSTRKLVPSDDNQCEKTTLEFHNVQISDHRYLEKVFKNLRQKLNLAEEAPVLDLKTNVLIWGLFMSTTTKAAVHLGPNYKDIFEVYRNTNFEQLKNLFDITQRLILEHEADILNVSTIDWKASSWTRPTLVHDQVDERKSTRLLRFRITLGEDARSFTS